MWEQCRNQRRQNRIAGTSRIIPDISIHLMKGFFRSRLMGRPTMTVNGRRKTPGFSLLDQVFMPQCSLRQMWQIVIPASETSGLAATLDAPKLISKNWSHQVSRNHQVSRDWILVYKERSPRAKDTPEDFSAESVIWNHRLSQEEAVKVALNDRVEPRWKKVIGSGQIVRVRYTDGRVPEWANLALSTGEGVLASAHLCRPKVEHVWRAHRQGDS